MPMNGPLPVFRFLAPLIIITHLINYCKFARLHSFVFPTITSSHPLPKAHLVFTDAPLLAWLRMSSMERPNLSTPPMCPLSLLNYMLLSEFFNYYQILPLIYVQTVHR